MLNVRINGNRVQSLLDSGSHFNLMAKNTALRLKVPIRTMNNADYPSLFTANGSFLRVIAIADIEVCISTFKLPTTVYITQSLNETLILGRMFLQESSAIIDFGKQSLTLSDVIDIPLQFKRSNINYIRVIESVSIDPEDEVILQVNSPRVYNGQDVLITPIKEKQFHRFATGNSIGHAKDGKVRCRLLNVTDRKIWLCKGQKVGLIQHFPADTQCYAITQNKDEKAKEQNDETVKTPAELEEFADQYKFNIAKDIDAETRVELLQLLYKRRNAFARSINELGEYNKQRFDIELMDDKPVLMQRTFSL